MSDDLVKRLRHGTAGDKERHKAADRIEKLETALREMLIKCTWENTGRWCGSIDCHCRIARKALNAE